VLWLLEDDCGGFHGFGFERLCLRVKCHLRLTTSRVKRDLRLSFCGVDHSA
jgi:hypothetical protein